MKALTRLRELDAVSWSLGRGDGRHRDAAELVE
jgi:hypothetical protein